jgi:hypothetical protein
VTTSSKKQRTGPWKDLVKVTLLVTPQQDSALAESAYRGTCSRSKIARQALQEYFDRHSAEPQEAGA